MKEEIYERDYCELMERKREIMKESGKDLLEITLKSGILASIDNKLNAMPHALIPEKKDFYEKCLRLLDGFAINLGGKIRGVFSYKAYDAQIHLTLPFCEFSGKREMDILRLVASQADGICMYPEKDGKIRLAVYMNCFQILGDKEKIIDEEIDKCPEVIECMAQAHEAEIDALLADAHIYNMIERAAAELGVTPREFLELLDRVLREDCP